MTSVLLCEIVRTFALLSGDFELEFRPAGVTSTEDFGDFVFLHRDHNLKE
jgi:hypothetical protein